jgi:serine protease
MIKHKTAIVLMVVVFSTSFSQAQQLIGKQQLAARFKMPADLKADDYLPQTIVAKFNSAYRANCLPNGVQNLTVLTDFFSQIGVDKVEKIFPNHRPPAQAQTRLGKPYVDLSLTYQISYTGNYNLEKVINKLYALGYFDYAEPYYLPKLAYTPNDTDIAAQYHHTNIDSYLGWDISKGDSINVVIAITDTGVELTHPDLAPNIMYNTADPIDGIDNDNDGYTDNYQGWDLGSNDNDPSASSIHGTHVSGCAAARVDNVTGVAGVGFRCKFIPIKISNSSNVLTQSYQSIVYAADHNCDIINASWGSTSGGFFGQSVVDYAMINKNCLVLAAAGNNGNSQPFYPAAYPDVIAVAGTTQTDEKWSVSSYGTFVDICAPSANILSTIQPSTYLSSGGTSLGCPLVSGVAALIKSHIPSYNAYQIGEHLKATAKSSILSLPGNTAYAGQLGTGLVNLYNALSATNPKSVKYTSVVAFDNADEIFVADDTVNVSGTFLNYLSPTTASCVATISTTSPYITLLSPTNFSVGALATLGQINNNTNPFKLKINAGAPLNSLVEITVTITDGSYSSSETFAFYVNLDFMHITVNDVWTTVSSNGRIGYRDVNQLNGYGFLYMNSLQFLYEGGFMLGDSPTRVSDMFRNNGVTPDQDNNIVGSVRRESDSPASDFDVYCVFNDSNATSIIGLSTKHKVFAYTAAGHRKYIIHEYSIKNNSADTVTDLYASIIADWDVQNYTENKVNQDLSNKIGYAYNTSGADYYAGIKVLTSTPFVHYGVDIISGGGGGVDVTAGAPAFEAAEKYTVMSTNRPTAGAASALGNDVMNAVSTGPLTVLSGDSVKVAFALIAGNDLSDLLTSAANAQTKYNDLVSSIKPADNGNVTFLSAYPNPSSGKTTVNFVLDKTAAVTLYLTDNIGRQVAQLQNGMLSAGNHAIDFNTTSLDEGIYFATLSVNQSKTVIKVMVTH